MSQDGDAPDDLGIAKREPHLAKLKTLSALETSKTAAADDEGIAELEAYLAKIATLSSIEIIQTLAGQAVLCAVMQAPDDPATRWLVDAIYRAVSQYIIPEHARLFVESMDTKEFPPPPELSELFRPALHVVSDNTKPRPT